MKDQVIKSVIDIGFTHLYIVLMMMSSKSFFLNSFNKCTALTHLKLLASPSNLGNPNIISNTDNDSIPKSMMFQN